MANIVLSSLNRFYVAKETSYGTIPVINASNRISAIKLDIRQQREARARRDKTGTRTYGGVAAGGRKTTQFALQTYLTVNATPSSPPAMGALVEAALGGSPLTFSGAAAGAGSSATQIVFSGSHGLVKGQAFRFNSEIRFVKQVVNSTTVQVNAPFSAAPQTGNALGAAVSYFPAENLPSVALIDYWDPSTVVDRILCGAACNQMQVKINGDYHEMEFSGEAQDVLDTVSFATGQGGLSSFPSEPTVSQTMPQPVPGNLGQAWLGTPTGQFFTVSSAVVQVDNEIELRNREFGMSLPQAIVAGVRRVIARLEMLEADDSATRDLYGAARSETPVAVMFQLGQASGQLMGVYMEKVVPQVPVFNDDEAVLKWDFGDSRAQGLVNDEIVVAFG